MDSASVAGTVAKIAAPYLGEIADAAAELDRHGWAEANAGNISVRIDAPPDFAGNETRTTAALPHATGLLITGTGTRMRDIARAPLAGLSLVRTGPDRTVWTGVRPSSELPAHLACHAALERGRPDDRCLVHTHPTALIALTLVYPEPETLVAVLLRSVAEMELLRGKLVMIPFLEPGSQALAEHTARAIERFSAVIWPRHGIVASGPTFARALDIIGVIDKAADVALRAGRLAAPGPARTQGEPGQRTTDGRPHEDGIETLHDVRSHDSSLSPEQFRKLPRRPVHLVLDNLRSAFNVGSLFRVADAARLAEVVLCGYTASPPHHKLEQTALGTTNSVPWRRSEDTAEALRQLRTAGVQVVGLETTSDARSFHEFRCRPPVALVLGNEALGLSQSVLSLCDAVVQVPLAGYKNSLNVAAAGAVVVFDLLRQQGWLGPD